MTLEVIIFYVLLVDAIVCNLMVWCSERWYTKHFRTLSRLFPLARGWAVYYLVLIIWIGTLVYRLTDFI